MKRQVRGPLEHRSTPVLVVIVLRRYLCQGCKATMTVGPLGLLTRRLFSAAALGLALCLWGTLKETALRVPFASTTWIGNTRGVGRGGAMNHKYRRSLTHRIMRPCG